MESFEPGNKHKIVPAVAAGGRGAQPCVALLGTAPRFGQGGVCLQEQVWGVDSTCANLLPSPSDVLFWGESCSDGIIEGAEGVGGGGNDHWQRELAVSGCKNSVRRVSVLAWKCACREISSHPAGAAGSVCGGDTGH